MWLSSHSCNYVSSIGCCQYGTWATCTHQFHSCLQFLSHTDAAAAVETHYCPGVVKYRYRYQYQYHTVTGLAACRSVRRVCISLSFGHNWALLCTAVCSTHNVTVALLAVCYCLTATFKQQTSCLRTNVAWNHSNYLTRRPSARIFLCILRLSSGFLNFKAWYQRCVPKHSTWLVNAHMKGNYFLVLNVVHILMMVMLK